MPLVRTPGAECRRRWAGFRQAAEPAMRDYAKWLADPQTGQERRLLGLLQAQRETAFGRHYDFSTIRSAQDYRRRVPVHDWPLIEPWVERACREREPVLTTEKPVFFERTSGSGAAAKRIPYTPALLREFQIAVVVWLASLFDDCPAIADGRSYWALSPPLPSSERTANGIPVGNASDADYLADSPVAELLPTVLAPPGLDDTGSAWRVATLTALIEADDLSLVSVWSPTFLLALLQPLLEPGESLLRVTERLDARRRAEVQAAVNSGDLGALWPRLAVVSCWMDGPSAAFAQRLQALLPGIRLSPKGLLATEGVVSLPWGLSGRCPLALGSHVLEFSDSHDRTFSVSELEQGSRYQPIITTGGGLYRYRTGDVVEVTGFLQRTPCLQFIGRGETGSDLVGEKLDDGIVGELLEKIRPPGGSVHLVPFADASPPHYVFVSDNDSVEELARKLEHELDAVHHYRQARLIGQLGAVCPAAACNTAGLLQAAWEETGGRAGDLKASHLVTSPRFARAIIGRVLGTER